MKIEQGEEQVVVEWLTRHQRESLMREGMSRSFFDSELARMRTGRAAPELGDLTDLVGMLDQAATGKLGNYLRVRRSRQRQGRRQVELSAEAHQALSDIAKSHGVGLSEAVLMLSDASGQSK